jgi:hypothetical protein
MVAGVISRYGCGVANLAANSVLGRLSGSVTNDSLLTGCGIGYTRGFLPKPTPGGKSIRQFR